MCRNSVGKEQTGGGEDRERKLLNSYFLSCREGRPFPHLPQRAEEFRFGTRPRQFHNFAALTASANAEPARHFFWSSIWAGESVCYSFFCVVSMSEGEGGASTADDEDSCVCRATASSPTCQQAPRGLSAPCSSSTYG